MIARATRAPVELPAPNVVFFFTQHSSSNRGSPNPIASHFHRPDHSGEEIRQESLALRQIYHAFLQHPPFLFIFFSSSLSLSLFAPNDLFINRYLAPLCFLYTLLFQILFLITYIIDHKSLLVSYANSTLMNRVIIGIEEDLILMKLREKYKIIYKRYNGLCIKRFSFFFFLV